jgi:hypothetical protein
MCSETPGPAVQQLAASSHISKEASLDPSRHSAINRRILLLSLAMLPALSTTLLPGVALAQAPSGVLPSWNDGAAKQPILWRKQ